MDPFWVYRILDPVIKIQWSVPGGRSVDLEAHEVHSPRRIRDFVGTHGGGSTGATNVLRHGGIAKIQVMEP